jgi:hypothetical protein
VVVVVVVVVVFFWQPPLGPTFSFSQPKLLMETSSIAALAKRRMEEVRIKTECKNDEKNDSSMAGRQFARRQAANPHGHSRARWFPCTSRVKLRFR